jgi:hypothetical protein
LATILSAVVWLDTQRSNKPAARPGLLAALRARFVQARTTAAPLWLTPAAVENAMKSFPRGEARVNFVTPNAAENITTAICDAALLFIRS